MAVAAQERSQLVNELLERIGRTVGQKAQASTIFGQPVEREGVTVVPVAKARFGFGGGGGSGMREADEGSGGGGGGGVAVTPIGYIEVRDGSSEFKRISTPMDLLAVVAAVSLGVIAVRRLG
ncbi:MAG TPA: spore germination protein GerW family protein [Gaiellaceae bacterium]|jgi:uncharacterized spore protein YtfJ|nr:spore germination protein GerW family protein [Gaiellaceae bacterium]